MLFLLTLISFIGFGCDTFHDGSHIDFVSSQPNTPTTLVKYERSGGGASSFTIADSTTYFDIHFVSSSYALVQRDTNISMLKSIVSKDDSIMLAKLFTGKQKISGTLFSKGITGTWNYVYINVDNAWIRVGNQNVVDELASLERQIDSILQ